MNALNQHPQIFATEQRLFGNFCELWPNNNGNLAPRITFDAYARAFSVHYNFEAFSNSRSEFLNEFIGEYLDFVANYARRKTNCSVIIDKITPYPGTAEIVVAKIKQFFPDAKIVKLVRDGRDVLTSGTFDWLLKDAENSKRYKFFVERSFEGSLDRFFDDEVVLRWAKVWRESLSIFKQVECSETVRYESMIESMSDVMLKLYRIFGVDENSTIADHSASAVSFEKLAGRVPGTMEPTAKQRKGIVGDWGNFMTRQDAKLFNESVGNWLVSEKYEDDERWIDDLPETLDLQIQDFFVDGVAGN